jgi:hypothetical protein
MLLDRTIDRGVFVDIMKAHGIECVRLSNREFEKRYGRLTSSFTTTHHCSRDSVYYYTKDIDLRSMYHELGHLVVWDLIGRPEYPNFGCGMEYGVMAKKCDALYTRVIGGPTKQPHFCAIELGPCAIEAVLLRLNRKSNRTVFSQLQSQNWISAESRNGGHVYRKARAILDGMLIVGHALIERHQEKHRQIAS